MTDKNVRGGRQRLRSAGSQAESHHPCHRPNHSLHDPDVVQDAHQRRKENDRREHAEGERLQQGTVFSDVEQEAAPLGHRPHDGVETLPEHFEQLFSGLGSQHQERETDLQKEPAKNHSPWKTPAIATH